MDYLNEIETDSVTSHPQGRFCFVMNILEEYTEKRYDGDTYTLKKYLPLIYSFCWKKWLPTWMNEVNEIRPYCILDPHPEAFENLETISKEEALELKRFYSSMPDKWVKAMDDLFWYSFEEIVYARKDAEVSFGKLLELLKELLQE